MPINYDEYPENWHEEIRPRILARARGQDGVLKCEWCGAVQYQPHPLTGSKVVLTVAHLDQNIDNNRDDNLAALCQRCHLNHDRPHNIEKRKARQMAFHQFFIGVDPSSTCTGIALLDREGRLLMSQAVQGGRNNFLSRLQHMGEQTQIVVSNWKLRYHLTRINTQVGIEIPIVGSRSGGEQTIKLARLNGAVSFALGKAGFSIVEVNPSQVKKIVAGHGAANKDQMLMAVQMQGYTVTDHNIADAIGVALWCLHEEQKAR